MTFPEVFDLVREVAPLFENISAGFHPFKGRRNLGFWPLKDFDSKRFCHYKKRNSNITFENEPVPAVEQQWAESAVEPVSPTSSAAQVDALN